MTIKNKLQRRDDKTIRSLFFLLHGQRRTDKKENIDYAKKKETKNKFYD